MNISEKYKQLEDFDESDPRVGGIFRFRKPVTMEHCCNTIEDLMDSDNFDRVLASFNHSRKTYIVRWKDVSREDILNNYSLAHMLMQYYQSLRLVGLETDVKRIINKVAARALSVIKESNHKLFVNLTQIADLTDLEGYVLNILIDSVMDDRKSSKGRKIKGEVNSNDLCKKLNTNGGNINDAIRGLNEKFRKNNFPVTILSRECCNDGKYVRYFRLFVYGSQDKEDRGL